ncbi:hypothetical protein OSB04_023550 [Centaurea solstitialis]|uniref:ARM repeat superfamily protein n=1 Tax=Centaurea solstitialis TaxID=347529 RepID=A0AA38SRY2_9ASTR|nr:hypothetical protein OSB04_023550 [Centaurea solstitialis]
MEMEEHKSIWKNSEEEESMVSVTVGRVMTTLLTARPTKLIDSISRLQSSPNPHNLLTLSLENSLRILHKCVRDGAEKEESLDSILIPMIEHSLRCKESKHKNQEMILLNWLFQDEVLFQAIARNFSDIVLRKEDHHIALGWCILARRLIEYDVTMGRFPTSGIKERYNGLLKNLSICSTHLLSLINNGRTHYLKMDIEFGILIKFSQHMRLWRMFLFDDEHQELYAKRIRKGGFELPTRLSVAAADCVIALSVALTKKEMVSNALENTKKPSKPSRQDLQGISVVAVGGQTKAKSISPASEFTRDMEMSLLLWNLLDRLIMLVQRLHAISGLCHRSFVLLAGVMVKLGGFEIRSDFKGIGSSICCKGCPTLEENVWLRFFSQNCSWLDSDAFKISSNPYPLCVPQWSRKSRSLHAKGLERVLKWLHETKKKYHFSQEAGPPKVKTGLLLLSSCWKHYGILLHLEDHRISDRHKELLDQYLAGIEHYAGNYTTDHNDDKDSGMATINFFLNCLLLLLGRFTAKQYDTAMTEHRLHVTRVVASQLCSADDDVIDGAVSILKATIFGTNHLASGGSLADSKQMHSVLPLLLNLLDERDGTSRAVVTLIAEYCSMSADRSCFEEILNRLASENIAQRRNAMDVLSEVIHISSDSASTLSHSLWLSVFSFNDLVLKHNNLGRQDLANHLLDRLKDEDDIIRAHATKLLTLIDPSFVLPGLVQLICSSDATLHASAAKTLLDMLTYHNQKPEVVCMVLDCISNPNASSDLQKMAASSRLEGLHGDTDRVLKLIPEWSRSVKNWKLLAGPLVDKMFADPSNPIIVKFLSYIGDHLAGVADVVFQRILFHTEAQTEIDESFLSELDDVKLQHSLFDRLCPLLIIRLLPLRVFNDLKSSVVYGDLLSQNNNKNDTSGSQCIADLLLKRAFNKLEFEDVRKLSAELCGRIHPKVLIPAVSSELETATNDHDILKIKACLFSICTSLVVRDIQSIGHPDISRIRESIETILLWPSTDGDEVSKAQHGCIDCLAIMVCTELQNPEPLRNSTSKGKSILQNGNNDTFGFHAYVLDRMTNNEHKLISSNLGSDNHMSSKQFLSFRLCMANVLISACQKIADSGKKPFALKTLRRLTQSNVKEPEMRAACIQVLFSIVYHLKSVILPYSSDLLKASLEFLKHGSEMERMGGAKLLAALLAGEEAIVQSISEGLLEARTLLSTISQTDSSPGVRQLCNQLLACMTPP